MNRTTVIHAIFLASAFTVPRMAEAQTVKSGWVSGTLQYYENNGNYCDDGGQNQNCTDTTYKKANYHQARALRDIKVAIWATYPNNNPLPGVVGTGGTDSSGKFVVAWSNPNSAPDKLYAGWYPEDKNGRFSVLQTGGLRWAFSGSTGFAPKSGTTSSTPQSLDVNGKPTVWGSASNPAPLSTVYAAAQWNVTSLVESSFLDQILTGIEIRAFFSKGQKGPLGVCDTSCAGFAGTKPTIQMDADSGYQPQARILHEMGHIASQLLNRRRQTGDYCWPDQGQFGTCTVDFDGDGTIQSPFWDLDSGEWMNTSVEEGFATFIGDRAIYRQTAISPTTCLSAGACPASTARNWVERSTGNGAVSSCAQNGSGSGGPIYLRRSALIVDRYLRDIYDSSNDSASCPAGDTTCQRGTSHNDTMARSWPEVLGVVTRFPNGLNDNQDEEPFDAAGNIEGVTPDGQGRDGFRVADYANVYKTVGTPIVDTGTARTYNCVVF